MYDIRSDFVLGMHDLWHMWCSMSIPIQHMVYLCGAHDSLSFGLLWITTIVPGGDSGVRLYSNDLNMCM